MFNTLIVVASLISSWIIFEKMGRQGWEGIIPFYNFYVMCDVLYGNGWKCLCLLIPIYNIYFAIMLYIDLSYAFHKGIGFAFGIFFLPFIFLLILAFDNKSYYGNGNHTSASFNTISHVISNAKERSSGSSGQTTAPYEDALEKLAKLSELKEKGVITEDEFNEKKAELLEKV